MNAKIFGSLGQFASFLERAVIAETTADVAARAVVAGALVHHVKDRIGHEALLPPPLAEATQEERGRLGYGPDETLLREGTLRDSYSWGHESLRTTTAGSTDPVAVYQEFGTVHIPGRAPLAGTFHENEPELFDAYLLAFAAAFRP